MTSNIGAEGLQKLSVSGIGFDRENGGLDRRPGYERLNRVLNRAAVKRFSPEFLNRCDGIVSYEPLSLETAGRILDMQLNDLQKTLSRKSYGFELIYSAGARQALLDEGFSREYGARNIRRAVQRLVLQPLAEHLLEGRISPVTARVKVDRGVRGLQFSTNRR